MKQPRNTLQELALQAKKRMCNGYSKPINSINVSASGKVITFEKSSLPINSETNCYKIYEALQSTDTVNPLSRLIDKELLETLTPEQRQRYVFKLSEAYISVKHQIVGDKLYR